MGKMSSGHHPILLATRNEGKLREIQAILGDLPIAWRTLTAFPHIPDAVEDGATFAANAARKAIHYSQHSGLWALADDSGLEVDALGGEPGVHSARYAGDLANDAANNAKLIDALRGIPDSQRTARFQCALALASGATIIAQAEGTVEGLIIDHPRGTNGFGYDPHFLVPSLSVTTAELPREVKNARSHRGQALQRILPRLLKLCGIPMT